MMAVHKELEDAMVSMNCLVSWLQATQAECAKVEAAAMASAEATATHLGQLQEAQA